MVVSPDQTGSEKHRRFIVDKKREKETAGSSGRGAGAITDRNPCRVSSSAPHFITSVRDRKDDGRKAVASGAKPLCLKEVPPPATVDTVPRRERPRIAHLPFVRDVSRDIPPSSRSDPDSFHTCPSPRETANHASIAVRRSVDLRRCVPSHRLRQLVPSLFLYSRAVGAAMQVASLDHCLGCGKVGSSRASSSSLLTDSTGYGSFPRRTPDSDSSTGPYYSTTASDYGPTTELKRRSSQSKWRESLRLKSAISEASIDSFFRDGGAEYYDFDAVVLDHVPCIDDVSICSSPSMPNLHLCLPYLLQLGEEQSARQASEDSLDDVAPSSELARADIATMASSIIDLIADLKTSCSFSSRSASSIDRPPPEEHIYEEITYDSTSIQLHDIYPRPPPLPQRRPAAHSTATLPREFPPILRKKKMPSKHRDACVRWEDQMTCGSLRSRLTGGRKVAAAGDGASRRTETKDFLTMPAASTVRTTFA
uniref:Uncharacterized protein n=1 Tax=Plectus sambesii TaxID=2011161 RepID=A0A914XE94_9BILA